jgi:hypothetical protein
VVQPLLGKSRGIVYVMPEEAPEIARTMNARPVRPTFE